jgi:undecaprenyl-diphosphatase
VNALSGAMRRRLDPEQRYGLRVTLLAVAFLIVAVPFGWLVDEVREKSRLVRFDHEVAARINDWVHGSRAVVVAADVASFVGEPVVLTILVAAVAVFFLVRRRYRLLAFLVVTTASGALLNSAVKEIVGRARPTVAHPIAVASGKSFPSGHAMGSTIAYGALLFIALPHIERRWRPFAVAGTAVLVALICLSRLALGVHYLSDVVGGVLLGSAWLLAATAAFRIWGSDRPAHDPAQEVAGE